MSLNIAFNNCGKSYNRKWLFRNLNLELRQGEKWVFLGANGSGKSTLALMLCAQVWPTEGKILWETSEGNIPGDHVFSQVALASPAMELPQEFSLEEVVLFHGKIKPFSTENAFELICELTGFDKKTIRKPLLAYSSGMLQRVKLLLAALSDTPVVIFDEPLTNLDKTGEKLFQYILENHCENRLLVIASNRKEEYSHCRKALALNPDGSVSLDHQFVYN